MSRQKRELQKNFVVFCEGDTEYNYINKMRKKPGVKIAIKPINMHGGGYANFLKYIKKESQTNCLAKFIIVDADRWRLRIFMEETVYGQRTTKCICGRSGYEREIGRGYC